MNKHTVVGWFGMITFLFAYALVSNGIVEASGFWYNAMNITGALAIAYSLLPARAWPTITLELCFVAIGMVAIFKIF